MRRTLLVFSAFSILTIAIPSAQAPAPAPAQTPPPTQAPAAPRPRPVAPKPTTITIDVTDALGAPLANTSVSVSGAVAREGVTGADGSLRLMNMRAGNYRLRFVREGSITLEREFTVRAGESPNVDIVLLSAPPPPKAPEPVAAPPPPVKTLGAPGEPKVTPVPLFLEKNFIGGREARKDSSLGCAATGTATLHQLRDSWLGHTHDDADEWIYVVAGEGVLRMAATEQRMQAGTFSLVPHTITHALVPQGKNPLIVISVLSGPSCKS
jgi:mannose-6-phosphate isomerase-like protein (cupin superfamily)